MSGTAGSGAAYLTKDNVVLAPKSEGGGEEALLEAEGQRELDERLTGAYADGAVVTETEEGRVDTAVVFTTQSGTTGQDENQVIVLPEQGSGTFTITLSHSGGGPTATTALSLDASAATVQAAVDVVTGSANEVIVTKAPGRRVFGLTWSSAAEDETDFAQSTVAVTLTAEGAPDIRSLSEPPYPLPS